MSFPYQYPFFQPRIFLEVLNASSSKTDSVVSEYLSQSLKFFTNFHRMMFLANFDLLEFTDLPAELKSLR